MLVEMLACLHEAIFVRVLSHQSHKISVKLVMAVCGGSTCSASSLLCAAVANTSVE